jgi:hypothetical protein
MNKNIPNTCGNAFVYDNTPISKSAKYNNGFFNPTILDNPRAKPDSISSNTFTAKTLEHGKRVGEMKAVWQTARNTQSYAEQIRYHTKRWHEIFSDMLGIEWLEQKSHNTPIQRWNAERKGIVARTHSGAMLEHIEEVREAVDGIKQKRGIPCPSIGKYNVIIFEGLARIAKIEGMLDGYRIKKNNQFTREHKKCITQIKAGGLPTECPENLTEAYSRVCITVAQDPQYRETLLDKLLEEKQDA